MKEKIEKWLEDVNAGCRTIAEKDGSYPDYYVFQSDILYDNPDLLIIGDNPGGDKTYQQTLINKNIKEKNALTDLKYGSNMYIDNPQWKISQPILEMFSSGYLRPVLEGATIMNAVYFNSNDGSKSLNKFPDGKEMIDFCVSKTKEFIYEILKPKKILFVGFQAPERLGVDYNNREDSILRTDDDKSFLIVKVIKSSIPHYIIHHTSRNFEVNTGNNLQKKKEFFEKEF